MNAEHRDVLLETHRRMRLLAEAPRPPAWQTYSLGRHDLQLEHGPGYAVGWFGEAVPEYRRMRYRRAIDDLERDGYLTTWRQWGRKLSHVRLTDRGIALAERLAADVACG